MITFHRILLDLLLLTFYQGMCVGHWTLCGACPVWKTVNLGPAAFFKGFIKQCD